MINNFDAQHYASLYCQYDPESGNRNWKELLEQNTVETIDLLIAKNALNAQEKEVEVQRIIYYGSPLAQQLTEENRVSYSFQITAYALFPNIISVNFFDDKFNSTIPKPKFYLGQPIIVDTLEGMDETDYIVTGIALNYSPETNPSWSYCVFPEATTGYFRKG